MTLGAATRAFPADERSGLTSRSVVDIAESHIGCLDVGLVDVGVVVDFDVDGNVEVDVTL